jgi:hypothetical protein
MQAPLTEALRNWHDFYALIGTAAATLVGLTFVAASIGRGVFTSAHQAGTRSFLSPTVVHFSAVLLICLFASAPTETWLFLGILLSSSGLIGSAYSAWIWRRMTKHGFWVTIDMADRLWYTILPIPAYVVVGGSGLSLLLHNEGSLNVLAMSVIALLIIGIRNAWDMTIFTMYRNQN